MGWFSKRTPVSDPSARARFRADTPELAVAGVHQLIGEQPPVGRAAIEHEWTELRRHWSGPGLVSGSLTEITDVLRVNLDHDVATRGGSRFILITATRPNFSVQVTSMITRSPTTVAHRIWCAGDVCFLYSSAADSLVPARGGDTS